MYDLRFTIYDLIRRAGVLPYACALIASLAGCSNKFLDPTQVGRFRPTPAVNVILDSLGVAEEPAVAWETAEEPQPSDIRAVKTDYVLQPADVVAIAIHELLQEGVTVSSSYVITETGKLSIPEVGVIQAAGRTETQLEEEIRKVLSPNILREPLVTVHLVTSQQRAFSILGNGVPVPGRYFIPRYDFRLMDALATAQVQMQFNVSHIYVSRREGRATDRSVDPQGAGHAPELGLMQPGSSGKGAQPAALKPENSAATTPRRDIPEPLEPAKKFETEREMLDLIAPQAGTVWPRNDKTAGSANAVQRKDEDISASMLPGGFRVLVPPRRQEPAQTPSWDTVQSPAEFGAVSPTATQTPRPQSKPVERMEWVFENGQWKQVAARSEATAQPPAPPARPAATQAQPAGQTEWVFREGNWVQVPKGQGQPLPGKPPTTAEPRGPTLPLVDGTLPMDLDWDQAVQTRVIRIPTDRLLAGDARYNLVIKPGDTIHVPVDLIGEFYISGNVNRTGIIAITGRPMTLKMAIAAAGGLGSLAYPKRVEVIRRIGAKKEEIVMVDLDKIASGEQPDFFIKPNDLINVGTDVTSRWRAVLRNAFRAAYGFGFVYDRNFADADYGKGFQLPHWF